jgi:hypothetical protein
MGNDFTSNGREIGAEIGQVLEKDICKLLNGAESLLKKNYKLGIELFYRANGLYLLKGYDFETECRINDVFLLYIDRGLLPNI